LQETASGLPERVDAGTDGDADRLCAGGLRPGVTAYQRKVTPLDKIAAHGANNGGVSAELLPDGLYQGEVTIMQGIIFCYDTSGFHICHLKAVTK